MSLSNISPASNCRFVAGIESSVANCCRNSRISSNASSSERCGSRTGCHQAFTGKDKFLTGKVAIVVLSYLLINTPRTDPIKRVPAALRGLSSDCR